MIREYAPEDCREMAQLFYETVHTTNAKDYTRQQLDAWATGQVDLEQWDRSFQEHISLVAVENGCIVGFGDLDPTGYLGIWTGSMCTPPGSAGASQQRFATGWSRRRRGLSPPMHPSRHGPFLKEGAMW